MEKIPQGYVDSDGKLFPGLDESLASLDIADPAAAGHLIIGRLGTVVIGLRMKTLDREIAEQLVNEFNNRTGLGVMLKRDGTLSHPGLETT